MIRLYTAILLQTLILELPMQQTESREIEIHWKGKLSSNERLADKAEKILSIQDNLAVENVKAELEDQIEYNFLRTLASMLAARPNRAQEGNNNILELMQLTINGDLDFSPVVAKLPTLLRQKESSQLAAMLETLRENEQREESYLRQMQTTNKTSTSTSTEMVTEIEKILNAVTKVNWNWKEVGNFLKEIPAIFEGVQTIVESIEDIF